MTSSYREDDEDITEITMASATLDGSIISVEERIVSDPAKGSDILLELDTPLEKHHFQKSEVIIGNTPEARRS